MICWYGRLNDSPYTKGYSFIRRSLSMENLVDQIAEQHIRDAQLRGEFDNLPGSGKPLQLDDDSHIPTHLRAGYRLLKNANCLPPELELRKEIRRVEELLPSLENEQERSSAQSKLALLRAQLAGSGREYSALMDEQVYREKLLRRLHSDF